MIRRLILAAMLGLALAAPAAVSPMTAGAFAADGASVDRVPVPRPPKGQGDQCVADTTFMRRNHMAVLMHQRDATMHEGIRTKTFSLNGCVSCHAVAGKDGKPVSYESEEHFCRSCHSYAAVSIDCFTCHASRPGEAAKAAQAREGADHAALAEFLRSREQ